MKYVFILLSLIAFSSLTIPIINSIDWYRLSNGTPAQTITIAEPELETENATENTPEPAMAEKQVSEEKIPHASNEEEFYNSIKIAFDKHITNIKVDIPKKDYTPEYISKIIEKVNINQKDTNYYISKYNVKSHSYMVSSNIALDMQFTYSEVIEGFNTDSSNPAENVLIINSYEEFAQAIQKGIENTTAKIKYKITNPDLDASTKNLLNITKDVGDSNRGNYVTGYKIETFGKGGFVTLNYAYSIEKVKANKSAINGKAVEIVASVISPGMTELEKEKALHDYVVLNTRYDSVNFASNTIPKDSYTAYGVFINGVAVCEGYASAMDILLKLAGIDSKIITGTANNGQRTESHAWNMVKINGSWYYLDATWDDPVPDVPGRVRYDYFNLTEEQIRKDHTF